VRLRLPRELRGGGLLSFVDKGAVILQVQSDMAEDSLELGFREAAPLSGRSPAQLSVVLDPYLAPGKGFQSVVIPLSEFPKLGYVEIPRLHPGGDPQACNCGGGDMDPRTASQMPCWIPPGGRMYETGVRDRKEALFHWDRVEEIFVRGLPGPGDQRVFRLDAWALVPSYDGAAWKEAMKTVRTRRGADLAVRGLRLFGDRPLGESYAFPKPGNTLIIDETTAREGKASARLDLDPKRWGGAGFIIPEKDLRPLRAKGFLRFFVKGRNGGESFVPYLHSRLGATDRVLIKGPDSRSIVDVTTEWKDVAVPLADFPDGGDIWDENYTRTRPEVFRWDRVIEASFEAPPVDEAERVVYLDEIRFTLDKPEKLIKK
jgi:hypothetical protein